MIRSSKLPLTRPNDINASMFTRIAAQPSAILTLLVAMSVGEVPAYAAPDLNPPAIQGVQVDNRPLPGRPGKELNLGSFPRNIVFNIGPESNSSQKFIRLRSQLEGIDKQ
jgi:hypothetical protein